VLDPESADLAAGWGVLGQRECRAGASGRLDDEGVPERESVAFLELRSGQDQCDVELHDRPLAIEGNDLASGDATHRRIGLAGDDDIELLQHLGTEYARPVPPEGAEQRLGDRLPPGLGTVVRVHQDVGVDEGHRTVGHDC
jgi:hypothetical protein